MKKITQRDRSIGISLLSAAKAVECFIMTVSILAVAVSAAVSALYSTPSSRARGRVRTPRKTKFVVPLVSCVRELHS